MTIFDKIKNFDEEQMVEFLYVFSRDTIKQFGNFIIPSREGIREFLERKCPDSTSEKD